MKKNLFTIPILSLLFIFASCERNDNYVNNPEPKNPDDLYAKTEYNLDMRDFAMAVSKAMNASPEFRKIIKEEANLKFDGDYDVVIKRVMNKPITAPANFHMPRPPISTPSDAFLTNRRMSLVLKGKKYA